MLSCEKMSFEGEEYYLSVTMSGADHPCGLVEPDGVWISAGARLWGLAGQATPDEVRAVLRGINPATGEILVRQPDSRRNAAHCLVFSTPKSVSIMHAFGDEVFGPGTTAKVTAAHEAAVVAAFGHMERHASYFKASAAAGGGLAESAGLLAVGFLHRTSRAPDPHLHTHVLVANLVAPCDGSPLRALDARALYAEMKTTGALYECHLRYELTRALGLEWQVTDQGWSDIAGFDKHQLVAFSRRANEIRAVAEAEGVDSYKGLKIIALRTRPPKDLSSSYEQHRAIWEQARMDCGLSNSTLRDVAGRAHRYGAVVPDPDWSGAVLETVSRRTTGGSFGRRDVVYGRCVAASQGLAVEDVERDSDRLLASPAVVDLGERAGRLKSASTGRAHIPLGRTEAIFTSREVGDRIERVEGLLERLGPSLSTVSYAQGERVAALSRISQAAGVWSCEDRAVLGVAASRWAAASFESATGIDTFAFAAVPSSRADRPANQLPPIPPDSVVVLVDGQGYGPAALETVLERARDARAAVVLLGSEKGFAGYNGLAVAEGVARSELAAPGPAMLEEWQRHETASQRFGEATAIAVPVLARAMDKCWELAGADENRIGPAPIVVTGDVTLRQALLKSRPEETSRCNVVQAADLRKELAARAGESGLSGQRLIVLGKASMMRRLVGQSDGCERTHVVVVAEMAGAAGDGGAEVIGRLAEATRPGYLSSLGPLGKSPAQRQSWRQGATAVESYRHRWGVEDKRHPLGRHDGHDAQRALDEMTLASDLKSLGLGRVLERGGSRRGIGR